MTQKQDLFFDNFDLAGALYDEIPFVYTFSPDIHNDLQILQGARTLLLFKERSAEPI
jgi:hypothetical protein